MSKIYERLRNADAKLVEKYTLFLRLLDLVMTTYTKNQRLITGNRVYDRALEVLDHISYLIFIEDKKKKASKLTTVRMELFCLSVLLKTTKDRGLLGFLNKKEKEFCRGITYKTKRELTELEKIGLLSDLRSKNIAGYIAMRSCLSAVEIELDVYAKHYRLDSIE